VLALYACGLGLALVYEGLMPAIAPGSWKGMFAAVCAWEAPTLKRLAWAGFAFSLLMLWLGHFLHDDSPGAGGQFWPAAAIAAGMASASESVVLLAMSDFPRIMERTRRAAGAPPASVRLAGIALVAAGSAGAYAAFA